MKHPLRYLLLSACLMILSGCEEMFVRELDFKGETEPEMLVLAGNEMVYSWPRITVRHSFFFDSKNKSFRESYVPDANVTMRLNGKDYSLQHTGYGEYWMKAIKLQPLDTLEYVVTHPNYETVTARQVMPGVVNSTLASYELQSNYWVVFDLDFEAYQGNADDVIGIVAHAQIEATQKWAQRKDTLDLNYTYSNDIVFAEAQNLSAEGYYGTKKELLYFPASALQHPKRIRCFADRYWSQQMKDRYKNVRLLYLKVDVHSFSHDTYLYNKSLNQYLQNNSIPAPSGFPQNNGTIISDIMDGLEEVLGEQEPRQVYSNVNGGLGCVTGQIFCSSHQVIK